MAFAALLLGMTMMQDELLFPTHAVPPAGPLPPNAERLTVTTADGETLHGVHLKPVGGAPTAPLILGFGGNAWNGQDVASYLHSIFPDRHVVAFHYRGYRPSTGNPSAEALLADAPLLLEAVGDRIHPERTVAVGFSIGSGVAASLAGKVDGLVLVTPFDSLRAVARELYPWLPVGPFFRHEIDAAGLLEGSTTPIAILAAERDGIIPPARTEALRRKIAPIYVRTIVGAGHNDIYHRQEFQAALKEAMDAVAGK